MGGEGNGSGAAQVAEEQEPSKAIEDMTVEEKAELVNEVRAANKETVAQLQAIPNLPPMSLTVQRIETFIDFVLPRKVDGATNEDRVDFDLLWEIKAGRLLNELLGSVEQGMARAKLLGGVQMPMPPSPGDLVVPGQ